MLITARGTHVHDADSIHVYHAQIDDEYQNQGVKPSAGQEAAFVLLVVLASGKRKGVFQLTCSNHSCL